MIGPSVCVFWATTRRITFQLFGFPFNGKSMARVLNTKRGGVSPVKVGGGSTKMRDITVEIFTGVSAFYKNKEFLGGSIALMMSTAQTTSRREFENDSTMKMFGGMIAKNEASRPHYLKDLDALVTDSCAYGYESPQSAENLTAWAAEHVHDGGVTELRVPGAWALHCCGKTVAELVRFFSTGVLDLAILRDGWASTPGSYVLNKSVTVPGKGSWQEAMKITIAPRGEVSAEDMHHLRQLLEKYKFLSFDGRMCYCEGVQRACASAAVAEAAVAARDRAAVLEFHGLSSSGATGSPAPGGHEMGGGSPSTYGVAAATLGVSAPAISTTDGCERDKDFAEQLRVALRESAWPLCEMEKVENFAAWASQELESKANDATSRLTVMRGVDEKMPEPLRALIGKATGVISVADEEHALEVHTARMHTIKDVVHAAKVAWAGYQGEAVAAQSAGVTKTRAATAAGVAGSSAVLTSPLAPAPAVSELDVGRDDPSKGMAMRFRAVLEQTFRDAAMEMELAYAVAKPALIASRAFKELQATKDNLNAVKAYEAPAEVDVARALEDSSQFVNMARSILLATARMTRDATLPALRGVVNIAAALECAEEIAKVAVEVGVDLPPLSEGEMKVWAGYKTDVATREHQCKVAALKESVKQAVESESWAAAASLQEELEQVEAAYAVTSKRQRTS